ncbi:SET domain-containing protein-lysine N-methyltransferase [Candidatus Woesearchaeota archaeon]|nr:SET domain-containing protein-lysine N-methyltransferase [Candidatus Woesearchaeota archaeon]
MNTTNEWIKIKKSKVHGTGVYAIKDIPKNTKIIEYLGEKITKKESDKRATNQIKKHEKNKKENGAVYIFELNKTHDIDGNVPWNTAKYINHACETNAETINENGHIWIISTKKIKKGEEIHYNYGYDIENFEDHPCNCGSKKCIGYIVAEKHWSKIKEKVKKKNKKTNTKKHKQSK